MDFFFNYYFFFAEEKKRIEYIETIKVSFEQTRRTTTVYVDNQKILQLIIYVKDGSLPLASGPDKTTKVDFFGIQKKRSFRCSVFIIFVRP